jgi:hypothetical protein
MRRIGIIAVALAALAVAGTLAIPRRTDVVARIAYRLDWPLSAAGINLMPREGLGDCEIYDAYDLRTLDSASVAVARLKDGTYIDSTEPNALASVFARCVTPSTPLPTRVDLISTFSEYAGIRPLHNNDQGLGRRLLAEAGQTFAPPATTTEEDTQVIRFFALSLDGGVLLRMEARIRSDV